MGTGEANFLGGVAAVKGVKGFDPEAAKKRFFEIYLDKYAKPNSGIGFPGALELITQCKGKGLKVAVASSADRIKVNANLAAANLPLSMFDAIVSADAFEKLKPAPDIFLAASKILDVPVSECIVIEDALAGVQAAKAAKMRCIAVKTTLSEETLKTAAPSLIRNEIGNVSLDDILSGGSGGYNGKIQGPQFPYMSSQNTTEKLIEENNGFMQKTVLPMTGFSQMEDNCGQVGGFRRDIVRYGSLGIALSCLAFTISNWKAMQYASPKAIWNVIFGINQPSLKQKEGTDVTPLRKLLSCQNFQPKIRLNTAPLSLARILKGKFTVVGVHSAKFDNEKDLEAIRNAVLRYGITHPICIYGERGVNSWPTFAIVGPNGRLLAQLGEGRRKDLDNLVEAALFYGRKNMLDNAPIPLSLEKDNPFSYISVKVSWKLIDVQTIGSSSQTVIITA
ncbi:NHL repeat-containing protein 2 [Prunus yedoensis var. nudiflora]|uniref:NHL repeat-containing protein 2 n=1 Tax=Prunus yedoensis var. nudiflora TaxID=2094558 RepID=A0A314UMZ1_PRUYE|nr:NHL repeat-containing protein 2 [Prunus yedoensis var. nudiflora]